jgi:hypothetical protein
MANHMCLLNLRKNFELKKKWSHQTDMVMEIVKNREELPEISKFAIKVSLKDSQDQNRINSIITTLVNSRFIVRMFESIDDPSERIYYITVELSQEDLEKKAEQLEYKVKILDKDLKFKYLIANKQIYEPLRSKDINEIYFSIIKKVIPIDEYKKEGKTIKDYQFIHDLNE